MKEGSMETTENKLHWGNTSKYWMNVGISLGADGNPRIEVIKHVPNMTSFGMPGYNEQLAFNAKMERVQNEICRRIAAVEEELKNGQENG